MHRLTKHWRISTLQCAGWIGCCGAALSTLWLPFWMALAVWMAAVGLWLSLCWWMDRHSLLTTHPPIASAASGWGATCLLMGAALIMRLWDLTAFPGALLNDEAKFGTVALQILNGALRSPFGTTYRAHPTLFSTLQALSLQVGGFSIASLRAPAAGLGAITVGAVHRLGRRLWGPAPGIWAAILLATFPLHIHFSRLGINNSADPMLGALIGASLAWALATQARHLG